MNIKTGDNKGKLIFLVKDIDPYSLAKSERYQKMKIEVDYENYVFDINRDSEERSALFEKEYQKVVEVNNRVKQYVGNNIFYFIYIKLKYAHCN